MYPPFLIVNEKLIIVEIQRAAFQKTKAILCVPTPEHRHEGVSECRHRSSEYSGKRSIRNRMCTGIGASARQVKLISLEVRHIKWNFE